MNRVSAGILLLVLGLAAQPRPLQAGSARPPAAPPCALPPLTVLVERPSEANGQAFEGRYPADLDVAVGRLSSAMRRAGWTLDGAASGVNPSLQSRVTTWSRGADACLVLFRMDRPGRVWFAIRPFPSQPDTTPGNSP